MAATPQCVVVQEVAPGRRWGVRPAQHVLDDGGLTDLNTELEQLVVNPWRTPERVGKARLADQFGCFPVDRLSPARDRHRQESRKPWRCHWSTVAGFTRT